MKDEQIVDSRQRLPGHKGSLHSHGKEREERITGGQEPAASGHGIIRAGDGGKGGNGGDGIYIVDKPGSDKESSSNSGLSHIGGLGALRGGLRFG
jgi:hypothetical protein